MSSEPILRFSGKLDAATTQALVSRDFAVSSASLAPTVSELIREVRESGDRAVRSQSERFDGSIHALAVPFRQLSEAWLPSLESPSPSRETEESVATDERRQRALLDKALRRVATNLRKVGAALLPTPSRIEVEPGIVLESQYEPLAAVGVYAPGGSAAYASSLLMGVVTAKAAGVPRVIVCSPGAPNPLLCRAAVIGGADAMYSVGGAGAIAAMAYGTESIPAVDLIVGPGNAYVAEAKRQLSGVVLTDCPAGPSEVLVIADHSADPTSVALEMIAQAEHDANATVVALCCGIDARRVESEVSRLLGPSPRGDIIASALANRGAVLTANSLRECETFAEEFAAEHVIVFTQTPLSVRRAGTVFVGGSVSFGDYLTGANHILPTAGYSRTRSGLSVLSCMRTSLVQRVSSRAARALASDTAILAEAEGLPAHASAARYAGRARRDLLAQTQAYRPVRPPVEVDLSDNTNLFGAPASANAVLAAGSRALVSRYPSPYAEGLRAALARTLGVDKSWVVTGCGSDDLLDAIVAAFCDPGDRVAFVPPTFGMIESFARKNGVIPSPRSRDGSGGEGESLGYLCCPNNPTGEVYSPAFAARLRDSLAGPLLIDAAYSDYAREPLQIPGTIRLGTLSKAWGLAGLRVGYAVAEPHLVVEIEKTRGPYKVGALAEAAAVAALDRDQSFVRQSVEATKAARSRLAEELTSRGFAPLPSEANFLLIPVNDAVAWSARLRERSVSVRPFVSLPGIGDALRVTVGPWPLMETFLSALEVTR